jgi:hypothetical protein
MKRGPSVWRYNRGTLFLGDIDMGILYVGRVSILRQENVVVSPEGLGPENDGAGEAQQQL